MRLLSFILIVIVSVIFHWWLVLPLFALYAFVFGAYELIALGFFLDAYFGYESFFNVFYLSSAVMLCLCAEFLKPRLLFYDRNAL